MEFRCQIPTFKHSRIHALLYSGLSGYAGAACIVCDILGLVAFYSFQLSFARSRPMTVALFENFIGNQPLAIRFNDCLIAKEINMIKTEATILHRTELKFVLSDLFKKSNDNVNSVFKTLNLIRM